MAEFVMPALGADMQTGKVVQWLVRAGQRVRSGDVVAVVETHKGAIDVEIFLDGVIDQLAALDQELPVGAVLAQVHATGAQASESAGPVAPRAPVAPDAPAGLAEPPVPAEPVEAVGSLEPGRAPPASTDWRRARISPAARRRLRQLGLSIDGLHGSGEGGAVLLADVERVAATSAPTPQPQPQPQPQPRPHGFDPAQMRQAIAAAMSRSKREIPHYYLMEQLDFSAASDWLAAWNAERPPEQRLLPAVLLLKATALALRQYPQFNGWHENGAFRPAPASHIGWAIALRGGGLVAPAIHDVQERSLSDLMDAMRDLVQRARAGGLRSSELTDPGITVTSLGERGAESVLGVIYPPQVAIVGFGRVQERPWVVDGQVLARPVLSLSLAADHRVSDGHLGGQLLAAIRQALQAPASL